MFHAPQVARNDRSEQSLAGGAWPASIRPGKAFYAASLSITFTIVCPLGTVRSAARFRHPPLHPDNAILNGNNHLTRRFI
jgi:hypothetical protein